MIAIAEQGEAVTVTRHGKAVAMIVPYKVGRQLYPDPSFGDALLSIPHGATIVRRRPAKQPKVGGDQ